MKKLMVLFILICLFGNVSAQSKYFIYLKDKGVSQSQKIRRASAEFIAAEAELSPKAIQRRIKKLGPDNYITYADLPVKQGYINELENLGIEIYRKLKWINAVTATLTDDQIMKLRQIPFITKIEKVRSLSYKPLPESSNQKQLPPKNKREINDLDYGSSLQQNSMVDVPAVHNAGFTGQGVLIGFIDAGFDWKNQDATKNLNVIAEHDFIFDDGNVANEVEDAWNQHNHGTNVFSVAAGYAPGQLIGPAFGASFLLAKSEYVPTETRAEEEDYIAALEWMEAQGADVITSSLGYSTFDEGETSYTYQDLDGDTSLLTLASEVAFDLGIVMVTSAGNEGFNAWYYITTPADGRNIITVGAVNYEGVLAYFSSHGPTADGRIKPEVVAPGVDIYMAHPDGTLYREANGTSYSAPIVAGITGLLLSAHPHLTNSQVRQIIIATGNNYETPDNDYGYGLVSAKRAIEYPNLSVNDERYTIHKTMLDNSGVTANTFELHYYVDDGLKETVVMDNTGTVDYTNLLPALTEGSSVSFYFTYTDASSNVQRIPSAEYYNFSYGELDIKLQSEIQDVDDDINSIPQQYSLLQNYPNPFNGQTRIVFVSNKIATAGLNIYDILGRKVRTLYSGEIAAGNNTFNWNGKTDAGTHCTSGTYFYTLSVDGNLFTKKLLYLK